MTDEIKMKRFIGLDIDSKSLRVAVFGKDRGDLQLLALEEFVQESLPEQLESVLNLVGGQFFPQDRLAASLPASMAFIRELHFPFRDRKKISSALTYEMAAQLPVAMEDYVTFMRAASQQKKGADIVAAAVQEGQLKKFLQPFEESSIPLHFLDVSPFAFVSGLSGIFSDGLLAIMMERETTIALLSDGSVSDFCSLPNFAQMDLTMQVNLLSRQAKSMTADSSEAALPLALAGPLASVELAEALASHYPLVERLEISVGSATIETPFVTAAALARRAMDTSALEGFNLRQGAFALKSEWGGLRKMMILSGCLAFLTMTLFGLSMGIEFSAKKRRLAQLDSLIKNIYLEAVGTQQAVLDAPLQFRSLIRQMEQEAVVFKKGHHSLVDILNKLSGLPEGVIIDLDELTFDQNEIRISGKTDTFEAVNRMSEYYREQELFPRVDVVESKMGITDRQVLFRLAISLAGGRS